MGAKSNYLFIYADFVSENSNFGKKSSFIGSIVSEDFLYACIDLLSVFVNNLGRSFLNKVNDGKEVIELSGKVLNKVLAFCASCLNHLLACGINGLLKTSPEFFLIILFFDNFENIGEACKADGS